MKISYCSYYNTQIFLLIIIYTVFYVCINTDVVYHEQIFAKNFADSGKTI